MADNDSFDPSKEDAEGIAQQAYAEGHEDGYRDGWDEGHSDGYDSGYDDGYQAGLDGCG